MPTALELDRDQWSAYHPSRGAKLSYDQAILTKRREDALKIARKASGLLRKKYGAAKVVFFGSLAHEEWFSFWSDIDLAVWGIEPELFYGAVALVTGLSEKFKIDLVDIEDCKQSLRKIIDEEGIEI
ncbi:MAG: nucleotidyltransferase domain-containing protein [Deltaproteobacteria bacterium]|nr:nucleotidyltransferase domain-containing protein [Deltaproteobacteria bacterium]